MAGRSPRYPRHSLAKTLELTKKLFDGAHRSKIDVDTAAKVIGYTTSSSGAAASALGALRQFGLVDGLRGSMQVSELALRILQPMDAEEKNAALQEAAAKPEVYARVLNHFQGTLPTSDEPIRAFLIRQEGFSAGGAKELIVALRDTMSSISDMTASEGPRSPSDIGRATEANDSGQVEQPQHAPQSSRSLPERTEPSELITLPLSASCKAELRFVGTVTSTAYGRLIRHLELLREMLVEDQPSE